MTLKVPINFSTIGYRFNGFMAYFNSFNNMILRMVQHVLALRTWWVPIELPVSWLFSFWLGKLTEAAPARNDEDLLLQIRDKHCVAVEVKYHRFCYVSYTRLPYCKTEDTRRAERSVSWPTFNLLNHMFGLVGHASHWISGCSGRLVLTPGFIIPTMPRQ